MPEGAGRIALGFDFGQRRIGIATGDTVTRTATPHTTVSCTDRGIDWAAIERLLQQFQPDILVVGAPLHADGSPSALTPAADRFAAELAARARLPVQRCNEYGSSLEATASLRSARAQGSHRRRLQRGDVDGAAAAIILQRWLRAEGRLE
jgi:putative holliday junction resolvase